MKTNVKSQPASSGNQSASKFVTGVNTVSQVLNSGIVIEVVRTLVRHAPLILGPIGLYLDASLYFCKALYHISFALLQAAGRAKTQLRPNERTDKSLAIALDLFCVAAFVVAGCGILGCLPVAAPLAALIGWSVAMVGVSVHCYNEHYKQYKLTKKGSSAKEHMQASVLKNAFYLYASLIVGMVLMFGVGAVIPVVGVGAVSAVLGVMKLVGTGGLVLINVGRFTNYMFPSIMNNLQKILADTEQDSHDGPADDVANAVLPGAGDS